MSKKPKMLIIDMDLALAKYKEVNGEISQVEFCEKFKITTPSFGNYRSGKVPGVLPMITELIASTGLGYSDLVKEV